MRALRFFYLCSAGICASHLLSSKEWLNFKTFLIWPLEWVPPGLSHTVVALILAFYLASTIGAARWPERRCCRILFAAAYFFFIALLAAGEKVFHQDSLFLYVSWIFIFLRPPQSGSQWFHEKMNLKLLEFSAILIFTSYFASGIWKLVGFAQNWSALQSHVLFVDIFKYYVSYGEWLYLRPSALGDWIFDDQSGLGASILIVGVLIEVLSPIPIFVPQLRSVWAGVLMLFHVMIYLTMNVLFAPNLVLLLFFILFVFPVLRRKVEENTVPFR